MMQSPYEGLAVSEWQEQTRELVATHPLQSELAAITLQAWRDIFASRIGSKPFIIGSDIQPTAQILGFMLHELIALEAASRYPQQWRKGDAREKDLVYLTDEFYSIEIKTSSSQRGVFGNRSYAQEVATVGRKSKSGYYLVVNFEPFKQTNQPEIKLIRFGWLDHADWLGQRSATGQQAHLNPDARNNKLIELALPNISS